VPIAEGYSPTRGCFTDGLPLFWKGSCVGFTITSRASASVPLDAATAVIDAAFATWNAAACTAGPVGIATSDLGPVSCSEVRYNQNGPNQNVIVFRDDVWPYRDPNNTLGLTTVTFNSENGEIYDTDMEINATGKNLTTSEVVPANGYDLLSVVTHEAGHFLGLAHATSSSATMYASYRPGTSALRTLAPDDVAGICEIYPTTGTRNVAKVVSPTGVLASTACDPAPRHGFSTTCAANPPPSEGSSGCSTHTARGNDPAWALLGVAAFVAFRRRRARSPG
jgi:MYXO-CTERM domain-containing protein